ncbi:MAG: RNA polymerase factor sigma-54 [Deltaproteobacteria bacterium]|nr:RNA polymerase factor sigma-54 [Deltaproteobacteria bacterium]
MALEIKQSLKLSQQLVLTPQLQQAIKLLQLSQLELVEHVEQELLENPLLEEEDRSENTSSKSELESSEAEGNEPNLASDQTKESENPLEQIDWENYLNNYNDPGERMGLLSSNEDLPNYENTLASRENLFEHLHWQLQMNNLDEAETKMGEIILGAIDEDGYLQESVEELSQSSGECLDFVEHVLEKIQQFDPPGVGARNLQECLLLQIRQLPKGQQAPLQKIVQEHLNDLEQRNYPKIAKSLKISLEECLHLTKIIQELEPKPGRSYSTGETHYITPDVYIRKMGDEWTVLLNEDGLPRLKINKIYRSMAESRGGKSQEKDYVQEKLKSALWLIRSIHQRQRTLYKTAKSILKFQKDFFEKGINYLKPMILRDVAEDIEMHESTVSRVTTNKYVHTPHGIFELKYFFNSGFAGREGEHLASESIKNKIKSLVNQENPKKPLSDQGIAEALKNSNIDIARRTVAKYREMMGILPSSKRRQFY